MGSILDGLPPNARAYLLQNPSLAPITLFSSTQRSQQSEVDSEPPVEVNHQAQWDAPDQVESDSDSSSSEDIYETFPPLPNASSYGSHVERSEDEYETGSDSTNGETVTMVQLKIKTFTQSKKRIFKSKILSGSRRIRVTLTLRPKILFVVQTSADDPHQEYLRCTLTVEQFWGESELRDISPLSFRGEVPQENENNANLAFDLDFFRNVGPSFRMLFGLMDNLSLCRPLWQ